MWHAVLKLISSLNELHLSLNDMAREGGEEVACLLIRQSAVESRSNYTQGKTITKNTESHLTEMKTFIKYYFLYTFSLRSLLLVDD